MGYVLKERIGTGGYGEVWSAEAPGGMLKAVKFIFGFHDEKRAQRELKALDRIKHIRHPFLLSLERIDIVDGRMIVIAELAEMCMKVRFNQCLEMGQEGIEREELLKYMAESADALDYIAEAHSLAHLDIKPENLLLVSGHAKVADFGLVKDLQAVNQSLMDGLTPAYAAPELFDGQPGLASDQYSLAIVYQEMLTGTRPFSGSTAAQLANQHLHSRPNLNDLPRGDQAVIARALAKQPNRRFPNCRSLVEELGKRRNRVRRKSKEARPLKPISTEGVTDANMDVQAIKPDLTMTISQSFIPAVKYEADVDLLEPFKLDESKAEFRPTLIIGVGNTGTKILCKLREKISSRLGTPEATPSLRLLAMDVDRRSLFEATMGQDLSSLRSSETLNIPLRKPEEYRSDSSLDVSWIGRRWIYNVPKSQLTESLRPLGRLAFVDHHDLIYRRISDELSKAKQPEHLATTCESVDMPPHELPPQVLVVGSIAGGVGSGLILDLAFTIRVCMGELGIVDDHVFGLFSHCTSRKGGDHQLTIANSFSFLNEMYHYNINGYPGNEPCNVPEFDDQTPVFDGTYFVHFGDDLKEKEFESNIDGMAEYLYTSTSCRGKAFFDECRVTDEFEAGLIKTMGISFVSQGEEELSAGPSDQLLQKMFDSWMEPHPDAESDPERYDVFATSIINQTINMEEVQDFISRTLVEKMGEQPQKSIVTDVIEKINSDPRLMSQPLLAARQILRTMLGVTNPDNTTLDLTITRSADPKVCDILDSRTTMLARSIGEKMSSAITPLLNSAEFRFYGSTRVAESIGDMLQDREQQAESTRRQLDESIQEADQVYRDLVDGAEERGEILDAQQLAAEKIEELVDQYLQMLYSTYYRKLFFSINRELGGTINSICEHQQTVLLMRNQLKLPVNVKEMYAMPDAPPSLFGKLSDYAAGKAMELLPELSKMTDELLLQPQGGLGSILMEGGTRMRNLPSEMKRIAQNLVSRQFKELRLDSMLVDSKMPAETVASLIGQLVKRVNPLIYNCGGTARLMIGVPQNAPIATIASYVQNQMNMEANIIPCTNGDFVVCLEMDLMPSENVAMTILQMQPDCAELIERLHCRNDVEWTSLTTMC